VKLIFLPHEWVCNISKGGFTLPGLPSINLDGLSAGEINLDGLQDLSLDPTLKKVCVCVHYNRTLAVQMSKSDLALIRPPDLLLLPRRPLHPGSVARRLLPLRRRRKEDSTFLTSSSLTMATSSPTPRCSTRRVESKHNQTTNKMLTLSAWLAT